jgi:hypothetical protein
VGFMVVVMPVFGDGQRGRRERKNCRNGNRTN